MTFADLHVPGDPLVLPNCWDVASARAFAAAGYPAVGTTSLGVVASHGLEDGTRAGRDATVVSAAELVAADLGCYLTCDAQDGFSDDPGEVAALVESLQVDGVNLEDSTDGALVDVEVAAAKVRAVKERCPDVFVNARTDSFWTGTPDLPGAILRARRYVDAGADGIFLPGTLTADQVEEFCRAVGAPVNVLPHADLTRTQLADAGVARISTGSLPYRAGLAAALAAAAAVRDGRAFPGATPYDEVQGLHRRQ